MNRGGVIQLSGGNVSGGKSVEVIEDLPPLPGVEVTLKLPSSICGARLVPQRAELPLERIGDRVTLRPPLILLPSDDRVAPLITLGDTLSNTFQKCFRRWLLAQVGSPS